MTLAKTLAWLLAGDPSVRWQVLRDLADAPSGTWKAERARAARRGWGARVLAAQRSDGHWGRGAYQRKWTCTVYTLQLLRLLGLEPNLRAERGCTVLLDEGLAPDGGINVSATIEWSETCITGMTLAAAAWFVPKEARLDRLVQFLVGAQLSDGGWNCQRPRGARHGSFHTTVSALEGLRDYRATGRRFAGEALAAEARGREFLLAHRLYRSHRTGEIVSPAMTRFSFPPYWHYDVLRGLDAFQSVSAPRDPRLGDAIALVESRRRSDGRWVLQNRHPGRTHFEMERVGRPSRWNTLRALRILRWWQEHAHLAEPAMPTSLTTAVRRTSH